MNKSARYERSIVTNFCIRGAAFITIVLDETKSNRIRAIDGLYSALCQFTCPKQEPPIYIPIFPPVISELETNSYPNLSGHRI